MTDREVYKSSYIAFKQRYSSIKSKGEKEAEYRDYSSQMNALLNQAKKSNTCQGISAAYNDMKRLVAKYNSEYGVPIGISMEEIKDKYNKVCTR